MMVKKYCILFALIFCASLASYALNMNNVGVPIIRSFNFKEERLKDNWSVVQDKRGVMFFGVQGGVLEFNAVENTELIEIPNSSAVRSLCADENGIVFLGARKEFGYLKPDEKGRLHYESLSAKLDTLDRNFTEVCKVYNTKEGICFQSFEALYFYKDGKIKVVKSSTSFHFSFYINNVLYVLERGVGLDKYENGKLLLVQGGEEFAEDRIYSIMPFSKTKLLIASRERGLFIYDLTLPAGSNIKHFDTNASNYMVENLVYDAVKLIDNTYLFGTLQGGLLIVDSQMQSVKVLNRSNFLEDNKVNDLYLDNFGDLWLAQDNAVSIIELNSPFSLLRDKSGLSGKIQALSKFKERIYAATTLGVFYLDLSDAKNKIENNWKFEQLEFKSECFNFLKASFGSDEKLFVCTPLGLFEINGNNLKPILEEYCFCAYQSKSNPNQVLVGLKNGFVLLTRTGNSWTSQYPDYNIKDEIKSINEDAFGNFWLVSSKEGVYKIANDGLKNLKSLGGLKSGYEKYDTLSGLPDVIYNKVYPYGKGVVFATIDGFFVFDYMKKRFVPFKEFNSILNKTTTQIIDFSELDENMSIVLGLEEITGPMVSLFEKDNKGALYNSSKPFRRLIEFIITSINIKESNSIWMSSTVGLITADLAAIRTRSTAYSRKYNPLIRSVIIGNDSVIFSGTFFEKKEKENLSLLAPVLKQPKEFVPRIDYKYNSISFNFSYSFNEPSNYTNYSYYLEGYDETWKPWIFESKVSFSNLTEGTYHFHLKAKNIYGTESNETVYKFIILPPWYRTIWAYLFYTILFAGFVYLVVQLSVRRLKATKLLLENTVKDRTSEIVKQNKEIQKQKDIVEIKNKDITDSINYAKRIQETILPPDEEISKLLPESFILFLPKDILSGDFYWLDEIDDKVLIAAADCTGHGVPGALMSIVGHNLLNQAIIEHKLSRPSDILDELNKGVTNTLRQRNEESKVKDGMDIVLAALDKSTGIIEYSGANNPLYHIRNNELTEIKGNKFPIGIFIGEELKKFTNHKIQLEKGDTLYLFTDGYADQFGGPNGKKFKYNQFKISLLQMQHLSMKEQREKLLHTIKTWQGENEQVDDILVIGIRI